MDYRLELLNDSDFENLINSLCQKILGIGSIIFAPGKDGGRDGQFSGTAQKFPSEIEPWSGKFIIQAKHTENPIASCSDRDFERIIKDEIIKIIKLREAGEIDFYMLFTNRKYTGIKGEQLRNKIIADSGIKDAVIIGKEQINNIYLTQNKDIVKIFKLDLHHIPFDFSDEEIKEIILTFKAQLPSIENEIKTEVEKMKYDFDKIEIEKKNEKNILGHDYYQNEILSRSLVDFSKIQQFLDNPINEQLKDYYFDIAAELSQVITLKRDNFDAFEEIFFYIYKIVSNGDNKLNGSKRHILTLLHYMYFECLIGIK